VSLEKDLVADCQKSAEAMGAFLAVVGQRNAKKSGSTLGFPDLCLICAGRTILIELKRAKDEGNDRGKLNLGQIAFIEKAAEHHVHVFTIDRVEDFERIVNGCRRRAAS
jgi:hypothetical protein